jgi:DNA (cytosine-5)-methyltransferase 1
MEWQAGDKYNSLFDCLIQFRPSGVRVKRPDKFSTLVAMNHRQIIGKLRRKISINESKTLQSFPKNYQLSEINAVAMKQLGNSVNVKVIHEIFKTLLKHYS